MNTYDTHPYYHGSAIDESCGNYGSALFEMDFANVHIPDANATMDDYIHVEESLKEHVLSEHSHLREAIDRYKYESPPTAIAHREFKDYCDKSADRSGWDIHVLCKAGAGAFDNSGSRYMGYIFDWSGKKPTIYMFLTFSDKSNNYGIYTGWSVSVPKVKSTLVQLQEAKAKNPKLRNLCINDGEIVRKLMDVMDRQAREATKEAMRVSGSAFGKKMPRTARSINAFRNNLKLSNKLLLDKCGK